MHTHEWVIDMCRMGKIVEEEFHKAILLHFCFIKIIESNLEKYTLSAWLTFTNFEQIFLLLLFSCCFLLLSKKKIPL